MSVTYPDLIYTNFPDEHSDLFDYVSDISSEQLALMNQYKLYLTYNDLFSANKLLEDNPSLKSAMINAEKINKLIDAIKATQRLYKDDIQSYLVNLVKYKGTYSNTSSYAKYNVVTQTIDGKILAYMCIMDAPAGIQPTNTSYWVAITQQGERGAAGLGLNYGGKYLSSTEYPLHSMVAHNNALWASLEPVIDVEPSDKSDVWEKIMSFNMNDLSFTDTTIGTQYKLVVDSGKIYLEEL